METKRKKGNILYIGVSICIGIGLLINHYNGCSKRHIESYMILKKEYLGNKFIQVLINNENDMQKYNESYGFDESIMEVDFEEEVVFICSLHSVEEFFYREKNSQKNGLRVLDIVFNKEEEDKLYIYVLKIDDIITWEAVGANVEPSFV